MTSDHCASGGNDPSEITTVILPPEGAGNLRIEFGAETHVGCVRPNNEDQFFVARLSKSVEILATSLAPEQLPQLARSAKDNGWDEPATDAYDRYDEELGKRCL